MKRPCCLRPTGFLLALLLLWAGVVWAGASVVTTKTAAGSAAWVPLASDQREAVRQMVAAEVNRELERNNNAYTAPEQGEANLRTVEAEKAALERSYLEGVTAADQANRSAERQRESVTNSYQTAAADMEELQKQAETIRVGMENLENSITRLRQDIRVQQEAFTKLLKTLKQGDAVVATIYLEGPLDMRQELNSQADIAAMPLMAAQMGTFIKSFTKVVDNTVVLDSIRAVEEGTATPTRDAPLEITLTDPTPRGTFYLRLRRFDLYPFQAPPSGQAKGAGTRTFQASVIATSQELNAFLKAQGYDPQRYNLEQAFALIQSAALGNTAADVELKERTLDHQNKMADRNGRIQEARRQQESQRAEKERKERELLPLKNKAADLAAQKERVEADFARSQATLQEKKRVREAIFVENERTLPKGGQRRFDAAIETMMDKYDKVKSEARTQHSKAATTVENYQVTEMTDFRATTEDRITALRLIAFLNEGDNGVRVKVAFRVRTVLSADADAPKAKPALVPAAQKPAVTSLPAALPEDTRIFTSPTLGARFALIPEGKFTMGSPVSEPGRSRDETLHQVTISKPFYLQTTEVTQGQWQKVMGTNPSYFKSCGLDCPVENVSWNDVQEFLGKLNRLERTDKYRLPTEAQWEYAARAGTTTALYNGPIKILGENNAPALDLIAWYGGNSCVDYAGGYDSSAWPERQYSSCSKSGIHPVGKKQPNAWGLHDMIGNVWEWVEDRYGAYPSGSVTDPEGPAAGSGRVNRGGSWSGNARNCRSAYRVNFDPGYRNDDLGFRLLRTR